MTTKLFYVIGAGIIGSSIAREIRRRDLGDVVVLEKENGLGEHASGRNSGVVHSGINHFPGTLKARMCVEGSKRVREYCKSNSVPIRECGTLLAARNKEEEQRLYTIYGMGLQAGVEGLKIVDKKELEIMEPIISAEKVLVSPTGAVIDSKKFLEKVVDDSKKTGADFVFDAEVLGIADGKLLTSKGDFGRGYVINCAGLYADKIAHMAGVGLEYKIVPFRGEYMEVNAGINSMVYQAPDLRYPFLGVHFTRGVDGIVLAGPNATLSFGRESYKKQIRFAEFFKDNFNSNFFNMVKSKDFLTLAYRNARMSLSKTAFLNEINSLLKEPLTLEDIKPCKAGIRAQLVDRKGKMVNDLVVNYSPKHANILNAVSPGMTCSLAFAEHVVDNIENCIG